MSGTPLLPIELVESSVILLSDHLQAKADFLLLRLVTQRLKDERASGRTVVISFQPDASRWNVLASRMGVNLNLQADDGRFALIDAPHNGSPSELWNIIQKQIKTASELPVEGQAAGLLVLDGLNVWDWVGTPRLELKRLLRATIARCASANVALIVRHHVLGGLSVDQRDATNQQDDLFRLLLEVCTSHIEVLPLASGRSGAVSGEIAIHLGLAASSSLRSVPRARTVQYRLSENDVVFFERGNAANVL